MYCDIKERSFQFSKNVVLFVNKISFSWVYRSLFEQLLKSATSVGANIIEARSGNSIKNLISYYSIALRSANETILLVEINSRDNKRKSPGNRILNKRKQ